MSVLPICMHTWCEYVVPVEAEEGVSSHGAGVVNGCGCWESISSLLKEQQLLLPTESSF